MMRSSIIIILLFPIILSEKISYKGSQLWRILTRTNEDNKILQTLEDDNYLSTWYMNSTSRDIIVPPHTTDFVRRNLEENNITLHIAIPDIQQVINIENPPNTTFELDQRHGHRLNWRAYHTLEVIYGYLDYLAATYPQLCSLEIIGDSFQKRPIKLLKISNGNPNNFAIWMDAGIHAREWIAPASATYIIDKILENYYENDADVKAKFIDWYIVPVLNPDGYVYSYTVDRLWRKNLRRFGECVGVDLNRNFGYMWGAAGGASRNPCQNTFMGPYAFSEPESAAVAQFFNRNQNKLWRGFISLHSYGQMVLYPWGFSKEPLYDQDDVDNVGKAAAQRIFWTTKTPYSIGSAASMLYLASGSTIDWARGYLGIKYSYTIELRDRGENFGFLLPANMIESTSQDALIFVTTVAEAALSQYFPKITNSSTV